MGYIITTTDSQLLLIPYEKARYDYFLHLDKLVKRYENSRTGLLRYYITILLYYFVERYWFIRCHLDFLLIDRSKAQYFFQFIFYHRYLRAVDDLNAGTALQNTTAAAFLEHAFTYLAAILNGDAQTGCTAIQFHDIGTTA